MGDGPGYDHMKYEIREKSIQQNIRRQNRLNRLYEMLMNVDFGLDDEEPVARMAAQRLQEAYEMLQIVVHSKRSSARSVTTTRPESSGAAGPRSAT